MVIFLRLVFMACSDGRLSFIVIKGCYYGEIIEFSGGARYLSTISLKNFHLFKITESVINFCLKKFSN